MPNEVTGGAPIEAGTRALKEVAEEFRRAGKVAEACEHKASDVTKIDELNAKLEKAEEALAEADKLNKQNRDEIKRLTAELDNMKGLGNN